MTEKSNTKQFDLETRTLEFSGRVRNFLKKLPKTQANIEDGKQLIRSSGSVGANYIEANEALSKKDFVYRIKICRKETKESRYWLKLLSIENNHSFDNDRGNLINECTELIKIFSSIIKKAE